MDEDLPLMSNCTRCEICGAATEIHQPGSFVHICQLIRLLLSPFAAFALCLLILSLCRSNDFHKNSRLLLIFTAIFMILANIGTFFETTYEMFVNYVMPDDSQCDYQIFKPQHQLILRDVYLFGACGMALSSAALCIERIFSATFRKNYDNWKAFLIVGWKLVIIEILLSLLPIYFIKPPPQSFPYSPPEVHNRRDALHLSTALVFVNVFAIVMTIALIYIEKNRLKIFLFILPDYNESTIITGKVLRELQAYAPYAEFQLTLTPIVGLLAVLIILFLAKAVRKAFISTFRRKLQKDETTDSSRQIYYSARPLSEVETPKVI